VVSLVYLASQSRTQNREARAASVHQVPHEYSDGTRFAPSSRTASTSRTRASTPSSRARRSARRCSGRSTHDSVDPVCRLAAYSMETVRSGLAAGARSVGRHDGSANRDGSGRHLEISGGDGTVPVLDTRGGLPVEEDEHIDVVRRYFGACSSGFSRTSSRHGPMTWFITSCPIDSHRSEAPTTWLTSGANSGSFPRQSGQSTRSSHRETAS